MRLRYAHFMLLVVVMCHIVLVSTTAVQTVTFTKQLEKDGYTCTEQYRVFEKNVSCISCADQCSRHETCSGVFCKRNTKQCTGCRIDFDTTSMDNWNGSEFYRRVAVQEPHYGIPCTTDAECQFPNTTCLQSICDCKAGYRREPKNETCVLYCERYGTTYIAYADMRLAISSESFIANLSECKHQCSSSASCLGFNFRGDYDQCSQKSQTPYTNPGEFGAYNSFDYYSRNCEDILV